MVSDKHGNSGSSIFLFATENGTIDGWSPGVNPNGTNPSTVTEVGRNNGANAVYKGLAIAQTGGHNLLYSPNLPPGGGGGLDNTFTPRAAGGGGVCGAPLPPGPAAG